MGKKKSRRKLFKKDKKKKKKKDKGPDPTAMLAELQKSMENIQTTASMSGLTGEKRTTVPINIGYLERSSQTPYYPRVIVETEKLYRKKVEDTDTRVFENKYRSQSIGYANRQLYDMTSYLDRQRKHLRDLAERDRVMRRQKAVFRNASQELQKDLNFKQNQNTEYINKTFTNQRIAGFEIGDIQWIKGTKRIQKIIMAILFVVLLILAIVLYSGVLGDSSSEIQSSDGE